MRYFVKQSMLVVLVAVLAFATATRCAVGEAEVQEVARKTVLTLASPEHTEDLQFDLGGLSKRYGPTVVKIEFIPISNFHELKRDPRQQEQYDNWYYSQDGAHGSGFFISAEGHIITNAHVVDEANRRTLKCKSSTTGNTEFELELIGLGETDRIDIALLRLRPFELSRFKRLSGLKEIPYLRIADSDAVSETERVAILGYPEDSDDLRVKAANLSGRQYLEGYSQLVGGFQFLEVATASAVQSGNSGGAAINRWGELIGVPARGTWTDSTGWLIPSNVVKHFMDEIAANVQGKKKTHLLNLGLEVQKTFPGMAAIAGVQEDMIDHEIGVSVFRVTKGSLAEEWGLQPGDIVTGFRNSDRDINVHLDFEGRVKTTGAMRIVRDGDRTWDNTDVARRYLSELVLMSCPGQRIELRYFRNGLEGVQSITGELAHRQNIKLPHLGRFELPAHVEWAGMILQDFDDHNVSRDEYRRLGAVIEEGGVLITCVDYGSVAQKRGLENDHIVTKLDGIAIGSLDSLRQVLRRINENYDAWKASEEYVPDNRRYDPRNYVTITYAFWDSAHSKLVTRKTTVPVEEARLKGRSLDTSLGEDADASQRDKP